MGGLEALFGTRPGTVRTTSRHGAASWLLLVLAASSAGADLYSTDDPVFTRPSLEPGNLEHYNFRAQEAQTLPWAAQRLTKPRPVSATTPTLLSDRRALDALAAASDPNTRFSVDGSRVNGTDSLLDFTPQALSGAFDMGSSDGMRGTSFSEGELLAFAEGVPEIALALNDYLASVSESAMRVAMSLRGLVADRAPVDWAAIFKSRASLQNRRGENLVKAGTRPVKETKEPDDPAVVSGKVKKVVRSILKIILGFGIGLVLWLFVRRI